jgi:GNAT superfamily N-acetyltransferase
MSVFQVRRATSEDTEAIATLWFEMLNQYATFDPRLRPLPDSIQPCKSAILQWLTREDAQLLVADRQGQCIGYVLGVIDEIPTLLPRLCGVISDIGIDGHAHQTGIGTALLDAIHAWFREKHIEIIEVRVPHRHPIAQAFWRSKGAHDYFDHLWQRVPVPKDQSQFIEYEVENKETNSLE